MKQCLTDKTLKDERITLIANEKVVLDKRELAKIFNEYFSNIASKLDIQFRSNIFIHYEGSFTKYKVFH